MTVIYSLFSLSLSPLLTLLFWLFFLIPPPTPPPLAVCMLAAPLMDYTFLGLF